MGSRADVISSHKRISGPTAIDLATSTDGPVSEQSVISMFAKIFDSKPERACLVAIPKMSENGRNLANLYKIDLIEAVDQNAAIEALKKCVSQEA